MTLDAPADQTLANDATIPDLTALIGSRICHDLISPIGAIANGVELLALSSPVASAEMALIAESVAAANARIRFFRVAFGQASAAQTIGMSELLSITDDLTRGSRTRIRWSGSAPLRRDAAKAVFLALLCLETAMPWGGDVAVSTTSDGWSVTGTAERIKRDAPLWQSLADGGMPEPLSAAQIQFGLLNAMARHQGRPVAVSLAEDRIVISF